MAALLSLLSSLMWGTGDFLAGTLSRKRATLAVAGASQLVGLLFMVIIATVTGAWSAGPLTAYLGWAVLASLSGLAGLLAFYQALATGRMGVVSPITALGVLVPLTVGLLSGEVPRPWQYIGIVLAVVGVVLASGPEVTGTSGWHPLALAIAAALLFGLFFVFVAEGSQVSAVMTMTVQRATSVSIMLVVALVARSAGGLRAGDAGWLILIGVADAAANLLYGLATTYGMLAVVAVLGSLYPIVTAILAWLFHGERLAAVQYVGVGVAIVGVAAISAG